MIKDNLRFEFAPSREDIFVRFLEEFDDFSEVLGFDEKGFDIKNLEKFSKHFAHNSGDDNQGLISIYKRVD